MIFDLRPLKQASGIDETDVAKRLMDYGFHAPTVSFPVAGTLMVEPTESEAEGRARSLLRRDDRDPRARFRRSSTARPIASDNVLKNAPHTAAAVAADDWTHPYSREQAAFPLPFVRAQQVLAERRPHRQPVRRPQPDLLVPADRGVRRRS